MSTPYQRLTRLRERAVANRDSLPIGSADSAEGEFYTNFIDAIDEALLEVVQGEPEPVEPPKPVAMPERFDFDAFLLDLMLPRNQMRVWDSAGIWS